MEQRAVVLVHVPYSDQSQTKLRPAVILSNTHYNETNEDRIICGISSVIRKTPYEIFLSEKELELGKLPIESAIRCDTISRVHESLIIRQVGKIKAECYQKIVQKINHLIKAE